MSGKYNILSTVSGAKVVENLREENNWEKQLRDRATQQLNRVSHAQVIRRKHRRESRGPQSQEKWEFVTREQNKAERDWMSVPPPPWTPCNISLLPLIPVKPWELSCRLGPLPFLSLELSWANKTLLLWGDDLPLITWLLASGYWFLRDDKVTINMLFMQTVISLNIFAICSPFLVWVNR